jgi:hypothetical protein
MADAMQIVAAAAAPIAGLAGVWIGSHFRAQRDEHNWRRDKLLAAYEEFANAASSFLPMTACTSPPVRCRKSWITKLSSPLESTDPLCEGLGGALERAEKLYHAFISAAITDLGTRTDDETFE